MWLVGLSMLALPAHAQLKKSKIGSTSKQHISLMLGANYPVFDCATGVGGSGAAAYSYFFMKRLGLRGVFEYDLMRVTEPKDPFICHNLELSAQLIFNFFTYGGERKENGKASFVPERGYLFGGVGCLYEMPQKNEDVLTASFPVGLGIAWPVGDNWSLGLELGWHFTINDQMEGIKQDKMTDGYATALLNLSYKIPDAKRKGTGYGYKSSSKGRKCDPRRGCDFTFD